MKKLIYTTDFSKNSVAALNYAAGLSKLLDAELIVLHIAEKVEKDKKKAYLHQKHKDLEAFTSLGRVLPLDFSIKSIKIWKPLPACIWKVLKTN
jgi:hypothetical protein